MILEHRQFRHFKILNPNSEVGQRFLKAVPQARGLFDKGYEDRCDELFFHEIAHCVELVRRGQQARLLLNDFGWSILQNKGWTQRMADNECYVMVVQWLLMEEMGYSRRSQMLSPETMPLFFDVMTDKKLGQDYFHKKFVSLEEEIAPVWKDHLQQTMNYIVAAVDAEKV